jgi:hypothetical protein
VTALDRSDTWAITRAYLVLAGSALRTMIELGLLVVGSGLLGLAAALLLHGFELVTLGLELSTAATLGSSLVIGVVGAFALGLVSEGRLRSSLRVRQYRELEGLAARVAGVLLVAAGLLMLTGRLEQLVAELPVPFEYARLLLHAAGRAGLAVAVIAEPLSLLLKRGLGRLGWEDDYALPLTFTVWAVAMMALYQPPG